MAQSQNLAVQCDLSKPEQRAVTVLYDTDAAIRTASEFWCDVVAYPQGMRECIGSSDAKRWSPRQSMPHVFSRTIFHATGSRETVKERSRWLKLATVLRLDNLFTLMASTGLVLALITKPLWCRAWLELSQQMNLGFISQGDLAGVDMDSHHNRRYG